MALKSVDFKYDYGDVLDAVLRSENRLEWFRATNIPGSVALREVNTLFSTALSYTQKR